MPDLIHLPIWINLFIFVIGALAITWTGFRLSVLADKLADRTGLGEAITGTVFLGFITALPGLAASITAALDGHAALAISNAIGGIAIQTTFLAIADIAYTKANLEHAAASVTNMILTTILVTLLAIVLLGLTGPDVTIDHIHPVTLVLFVAAGFGFLLAYRSSERPMWRPRYTTETVEDIPDKAAERENLGRLMTGFIVSSVIIILSGSLVAHAAGALSDQTGITETVAGGLLLAIVTSLPELVTTVSAVRRGALTLAVSDVVGGNFFDVLFVFAADIFYFKGSIYHAAGVGARELFLTALTILLNIILLLGLLYRQRRGPANIGFESVLMLLIYVGGFLTLIFFM